MSDDYDLSGWTVVDEPKSKKTMPSKTQSDSSYPYDLTGWTVENQAPEESFLSKLPRNVAAGLAYVGHRTLNAPHDITQGIEGGINRLGKYLSKDLSPQEMAAFGNPKFNSNLSGHIPTQQDYNFAQMLGQKGPGTFADRAIQTGIEYAPDVLTGINAFRSVPFLTRQAATRRLNFARGMGADRNMGTLNINPQLIEDTRQFLPNTTPYRDAIENAHYGDYNQLFNLQSTVGQQSAPLARMRNFLNPAMRAHGREGLRTQNRLLDAMYEDLGAQGHHDIADMIRQGRTDFRSYSKVKPYRNALALAAAAYAVPRNAWTSLGDKLMHIAHR